MRKEARKFDHLESLRDKDYNLTWETIEKFKFNDDLVIFKGGHKIITSRWQAHKIRKRG
jgi:predicted FMN-binding regulatory protein PaiB